ncbi:MAG: hypothetical protein JW828_09240 [Sedimentisphaerales bacterium]|nr:hypothetical protein [Sedimentisphaerales bacterium]
MVIYVGNFAQNASSDTLRDIFGQYGQVEDVTIIRDRVSENGLGFGFVTMPDAGQARKAVDILNYADIGGRTVIVAETTERPERRAEPRG